MPEPSSDDTGLDPIEVEPTDNSGGAVVDLNRLKQTEDDYRRRQPKDVIPSL